MRRLTTRGKHHLADPALAATILGETRESLLAGTPSRFSDKKSFAGFLFESLVALSVRVYSEPLRARVSHLRTHDSRQEIDLIVSRADGRFTALQVKLGTVVTDQDVKHLLWLNDKCGSDLIDMVIINTGRYAYRRPDGVAVIPAALLRP